MRHLTLTYHSCYGIPYEDISWHCIPDQLVKQTKQSQLNNILLWYLILTYHSYYDNVTKFISTIFVYFVTPKAGAECELLCLAQQLSVKK